MKLVNSKYGYVFEISENQVNELVIENPLIFCDIMQNLAAQQNGEAGDFLLTIKEKELSIEKCTDLIMNPFGLSFNNRKIINKLYSLAENVGNTDYIVEKNNINSGIVSLLDELTTKIGITDVSYSLDFKWSDLFKIYDLKICEDYSSLLEKICMYIRVLSELTDVKILFWINIRSYFGEEDLAKIFEYANYCKINLFLIESTEKMEIGPEKRYIIDKDQCFIEL